MLKFLTKISPFILAALLAATVSCGQNNKPVQKEPFDQGLEMPLSQAPAAYSYSARPEVRRAWSMQTNLSYILWQACQENMSLGIASNVSVLDFQNVNSTSTVKGADSEFKSGFKLGLGLNLDYDHWNLTSEYTWFHGTTHTAVPEEAGQYIYAAQGLQTYVENLQSYTSAYQDWTLKMDFVDLSLSRSFYSGTKFTFTPYLGARGAWIRQALNTSYLDTNPSSALTVQTSSLSQGIGPRTGIDSNWLLGYGLKLTGKAAVDILYTHYHYNLTQNYADPSTVTTKISEENNGYLRAHTDLEFGFGWGSYFADNNCYFDLSADYGFQVFWDQNMFYTYGANFGPTTAPNGNLYVQGLTLTARLDY